MIFRLSGFIPSPTHASEWVINHWLCAGDRRAGQGIAWQGGGQLSVQHGHFQHWWTQTATTWRPQVPGDDHASPADIWRCHRNLPVSPLTDWHLCRGQRASEVPLRCIHMSPSLWLLFMDFIIKAYTYIPVLPSTFFPWLCHLTFVWCVCVCACVRVCVCVCVWCRFCLLVCCLWMSLLLLLCCPSLFLLLYRDSCLMSILFYYYYLFYYSHCLLWCTTY